MTPKNRTDDAVAIALDFLAERLSPLQAASRMRGLALTNLPCWEATGGSNGPLSALYSAADEADERHFLGEDVERWHAHVREQKRSELKAAEKRWAEPVDNACRSLIAYAVSRK